MINLKPVIGRIEALLAEDTEQSVTYAALEARLALERVAYDRLRQCHDYISHADLKRWQPGPVVNTLLTEVDQYADTSITLHISKGPAVPGVETPDDDFVELGTQAGFNAKLVSRLWNGLANLALHIELPESKEDRLPEYGDKGAITAKVRETLTELERLSATTMTFSGIGSEVSFDCSCGAKNRRRAALLREGQSVSCINPECQWSWTVEKEGEEFGFEPQAFETECEKCAEVLQMPFRPLMKIKYGQRASFACLACGHENLAEWRLTLLTLQRDAAPALREG
jgi:hypothetical protein